MFQILFRRNTIWERVEIQVNVHALTSSSRVINLGLGTSSFILGTEAPRSVDVAANANT